MAGAVGSGRAGSARAGSARAGSVTGRAASADGLRAGALVLTPGAGADRTHHTLIAIEEALAPMPVARVDFPYRRAGRRAPDRVPVAVACVRDEAAALASRAGVEPGSIVLGGRSYGGRMCSLAVAEGMPAAGLVLLSYPLHPPGRPDSLRTEHFGDIAVPCLFVSGVKDPFARPDELEAATASIRGEVTHVWITGGHDPRGQDEVIVAAVRDWLTEPGPRRRTKRER